MNVYRAICLVCCLVFTAATASAQRGRDRKEDEHGSPLPSPQSLKDEAGGVHNKSNIGTYFVNTGKLYVPGNGGYSVGPGFEWPIGSAHEFVYRANPFVGIPGNVVQGRYRTHSEWEAAAGYHNRDSAQIAFSDKPYTWPASGWHLKDPAGRPIFVSNQDSYCAYNDSLNTVNLLHLQVLQTGYAFSQKSVRDMVIFIFDVTNLSTLTYDSVYFGIYADIAAGGSYEVQDFGHRRIVLDKSLRRFYLYKPGGVSYEWNGAPSGMFGVILLQTPKVNGVEVGLTDWHYNLYADDQDQDWIQYGIMSSSPALYSDQLGPRFFHPDTNAPDIHFDDPANIPADGADIVSTMGTGPYTLAPGDTLRFITAWIAGATDADIDSITAHAYKLLADGFVIAQPPSPPKVTAVPGDRRVYVSWDNGAESFRDPLTGQLNFEGYHVYRSNDKGAHWDQIDRNAQQTAPDPVPIATFDRVDGIGKDVGIQHSFIDSSVTNGFEYWYSVTAFTMPNGRGQTSESANGRQGDINVGVATPRSNATGRTPVSPTGVQHNGTGTANVNFTIVPLDLPQAGDQTYTVSFAPLTSVERGTLGSVIQISVDSNGARTAETFSLAFSSATQYILRNETERTVINPTGTYTSGVPILFEGLRLTLTDTSALIADRPEQGDSLVIRIGVQVDTKALLNVLPLQPFYYGTAYVTSNGVVLSAQLADTLAQSRIGYRDIYSFATIAAQVSATPLADDLNRIKVVPNPYLVSSQYEQEFGILRREPIRQIKFNNLPARCTITIFSMAGDKLKTINHDSDNGTETWDMRTDGNREIAAGVYIYLVKTVSAEKTGRFAVIK